MSRKLTPGYEVVIVGSGVAGLYGALCAAAEGRVLIVSKGPVLTSSSWLAQGGIAAATAGGDAPELHAADTLAAGRGLCRESAVQALTAEAPARIVDLVDLGVRFDDELGLEGGHSRRRVHSVGGAQTGREISQALARAVLAHPRIDVSERERALELWMSERTVRRARHRRAHGERARRSARDRRLRGPLGSHDEPRRLRRRGHRDGVPRRSGRRRSRVRAVSSDGARGLVAVAFRGAARRRRAARRRAGRPFRRGAGAARRRRAGGRGAGERVARSAADRPLAVPGADGAHRRRRVPPGDGACPRRGGGALHHGRRRHGSRRRDGRARSLRRRRVRVHGRARREPARVELDARVPRLRPPRRPGVSRRAMARGQTPAMSGPDSTRP